MDNKYGYFSESGTYILNQPNTPVRWENKLFNDSYVLNITQRMEGTGAIALKHTQKGIVDFARRFYIKKGNDAKRLFCGRVGKYSAEYDDYKMTVSEESDTYKICAEVTVAEEGRREFWRFTVENKSEADTFRLFCFYPFINSGPMGGESKITNDRKCVYKFSFPHHVFYDDKEKAEKSQGYTFVMSDTQISSFDGTSQAFYGSDDMGGLPVAVENGFCSDTKGQGDRLDAALCFEREIKKGEKLQVTLVVGSADTFDEIDELGKNMPGFDEVYNKAQKYRETHYRGYAIDTPYKEVNYLFNKWLPKQIIYLTRLNRGSAYCPVRNQLQDALGYSMLDPFGALEFALEVLREQHADGYLKQWHMTDGSPEKPLCKIKHSDACIWLILCIAEIINNCGDISLFNHQEPYIDSDKKESILEHLKKAVLYMNSQKGEHGLCLMFDGDWTDPINGPGRKGRGESVWNSMALVYAIKQLTEIFPDEELEKIAEDMTEAINRHCWDGKWYVAGFDDDGVPYGKSADDEGKLFLNTQTWAFISDIVPDERKEILKKSIDSLEVPFGWLILDKPFSKWNGTWGRISVKQKGTTENGSVYCHATMFKALGDCIMGDVDAAFEAVLKTLPTNPENPTERNLQLPLYVPNYYFGIDNENFGKSSCNYSTGTTAWMLWVMIKYILNVKTSVNGISCEGNAPKKLAGSKVTRYFKGKEYNFIVQ